MFRHKNSSNIQNGIFLFSAFVALWNTASGLKCYFCPNLDNLCVSPAERLNQRTGTCDANITKCHKKELSHSEDLNIYLQDCSANGFLDCESKSQYGVEATNSLFDEDPIMETSYLNAFNIILGAILAITVWSILT